MMTIRQYARSIGFQIKGSLKRFPTPTGEAWSRKDRCYVDEAGNEYIACAEGGFLIITADGSLIG